MKVCREKRLLSAVSRETFLRLSLYVKLLLKWNDKINFIGKSTEDIIWDRHIKDSLQLMKFIKKQEIIMDFGTGAGFPGMVISIAGENKVILVEKNSKKCAFLRQVKLATNSCAIIKNCTIEETKDNNVDTITCRAFASLVKIFEISAGYKAKLLLLRGANYKNEIEEALANNWRFNLQVHPSETCEESAILIIDQITNHG